MTESECVAYRKIYMKKKHELFEYREEISELTQFFRRFYK